MGNTAQLMSTQQNPVQHIVNNITQQVSPPPQVTNMYDLGQTLVDNRQTYVEHRQAYCAAGLYDDFYYDSDACAKD